MRVVQRALTFDDVSILPAHSTVLPRDVSLKSRLTRAIQINIPAGVRGHGHRDRSTPGHRPGPGGGYRDRPQEHGARAPRPPEVSKVKRYESGVVKDPITIAPSMSVREVLNLIRTYKISGLPVVEGKRVVGIVTNRDLRFETNLDQPVRNIMTPRERLVTVREGATLEEAQALMHKHRLERVLVINGEFELHGLITVKDILKSTEYPNACKDNLGRLRVGAAIGVGRGDRRASRGAGGRRCRRPGGRHGSRSFAGRARASGLGEAHATRRSR